MSQTTASRARADLLRERIAAIRREHSVATGRARAAGTPLPADSQLGALSLADHFPAQVAAQEVDRNMLAALSDLLRLIEHEQARAGAL